MSSRSTVHVLRQGEKPHVAGFGILIEVEAEAEELPSGIEVQEADEAEKRGACRGILRQVGPLAGRDAGDKPENWGIHKLGNYILFDRYRGTYFAVENSPVRYILIHEKDVQMFIDPDETEEERLCESVLRN